MQLLAFAITANDASGQEMEARAYSRSPVGTNIALVTYSYQTGDVLFDPALPLTDVSVKINGAIVGYGRTFNLAGRQATASVAVPYVWGTVRGTVFEQQQEVTRSGLGDLRLRIAANLIGSPALTPREFAARKPTTVLGTSLSIVAPIGQYDPRRLVNLGSNRWAFKPEMGLSHPIGDWTLELIGGAWLFSDNDDFFGGSIREQKPLATFQGHVVYTIRPRMWVSGSGTYYTGGRTVLNGRLNADLQNNSRVGATFSYPVSQKQSIKVAWAKGILARIGGSLNTIAVGYQYTWLK
jgi:Putative MetA-pathway of phenol degradation